MEYECKGELPPVGVQPARCTGRRAMDDAHGPHRVGPSGGTGESVVKSGPPMEARGGRDDRGPPRQYGARPPSRCAASGTYGAALPRLSKGGKGDIVTNLGRSRCEYGVEPPCPSRLCKGKVGLKPGGSTGEGPQGDVCPLEIPEPEGCDPGGEDGGARPLTGPPRPTPEMIEAHNVSHIPFRSWCAGCVAGQARDSPHLRDLHASNHAIPHIEVDFFFLGRRAGPAAPLITISV